MYSAGVKGEAKKSGLIRNYKQKSGRVTVYYTSLERVIAIAGLDKLDPGAAINIDDLANIHIIATEVEAQHLQKASFYRQRQEEMQQINAHDSDPGQPTTQIIEPRALHTSDKPAGVMGKSARFIFCERDSASTTEVLRRSHSRGESLLRLLVATFQIDTGWRPLQCELFVRSCHP